MNKINNPKCKNIKVGSDFTIIMYAFITVLSYIILVLRQYKRNSATLWRKELLLSNFFQLHNIQYFLCNKYIAYTYKTSTSYSLIIDQKNLKNHKREYTYLYDDARVKWYKSAAANQVGNFEAVTHLKY
jgi:hypothetical protein